MKRWFSMRVLLVLFVLVGAACRAEAQDVTLTQTDDGVVIKIDGKDFTVFRHKPDQPKPFFSPVKAADGAVVTRPLDDPADKDHPHHKGIWMSVDEINEVKFWAEKGRIVNKRVEIKSGNPGVLSLTNHWVGDNGQPIVIEESVISIHRNRLMVYDLKFSAGVDQVVFEDTKEGLFGIRVAGTMREKVGGVIVNSDGKKGMKECWGQPAKWVDYSGSVGDKIYGAAMFDHPQNFRPSRHHVRDYGLFSVSPFGEGAYQNDKTKAKPVTLKKGDAPIRIRYGLYIHNGNATDGKVAEAYDGFLAATK